MKKITFQGDLLSTDQGGLNFTDIKNSKSTFGTKIGLLTQCENLLTFFTISPCCEKSTFFIGKNVLLINNCPPIYTFYTKAFFSVLISMTIHSVFCEPQKKNSKLDQKKNWTSIIFNSLCFCIRCICIHAYYG